MMMKLWISETSKTQVEKERNSGKSGGGCAGGGYISTQRDRKHKGIEKKGDRWY